jgi:hypothetical protein
MAQNMQIEISGYTKTGYPVVIRKSVSDNADAKHFMAQADILGLLPERPEKPDETEYAQISHVAVTKKDDGTYHIAYYHANENLVDRYTHKYFDHASDIQEFEAWSSLILADLPCKDDNDHPKRGSAAAKKYLVALPEVRALIRRTTYTKTDDGFKASHSVEKYIMPAGNTPSSNQRNSAAASNDYITNLDDWDTDDAARDALRSYLVEEGISEEEALAETNMKSWTHFSTAAIALNVIRKKFSVTTGDSHFNSPPGMGVDGFKKHRKRAGDTPDDTPAAADESDQVPLSEINF